MASSRYDAAYEPATPIRRTSNRHRHQSSHGQPLYGADISPDTADVGRRRRRSSAAAGQTNTSPPDARTRPRRSSTSQRPFDDPNPPRRRRSSAAKPSVAFHQTPYSAVPSPNRPLLGTPSSMQHSNAASPAAPPRTMDNGQAVGRRNSFGRKKSLVRPERRQLNPQDAGYHYTKHAQNMPVMPSTTGRDPQLEEDAVPEELDITKPDSGRTRPRANSASQSKNGHRTLRKPSRRERERREQAERDARRPETVGPPSLWRTYCSLVTFWCPDSVLRCFGFRERERRRAWREKMGLLSIMVLVMGFVGFLTFGFTEAVCSNGGGLRLRVNRVDATYMIFHGQAYDLSQSHHPLARGISPGANVLYDLAEPHGGQDGSFLFQNVNGACKDLITLAPGSDVPVNANGDLAWYFPCHPYNQDGSSRPDYNIPYYLGYACHTAHEARTDFYDLRSSGDVYFTWEDVKNTSRNLIVYSGSVLDLNLLSWFNRSQVAIPDRFAQLQNESTVNEAIRGMDVTLAWSNGENKQIAECLTQIIKVGSVDTDTVGCFASRVVLYLSLTFILGIVLSRFLAALLFQWFLCRKYAAPKTSMGGDSKRRKQQIEDWSENIYRPPPKITEPIERDRSAKRGSFLPTTSRFTSPYAIERAINKARPPPTTMASQQSTARLLPGSSGGASGFHNNRSETTFQTYQDPSGKPSLSDGPTTIFDRYSGMMHSDDTVAGPQGFIHESVVPQPPAEWQPFGFPLAHTICLVTAYSEGLDGIRTTLDSVAMTDYPNSHKLIFVVCDGLVKGKGESMSTPEACISMMKDCAVPFDEVQPFSYVAVASGAKRHNMAKVYAGFYDYGHDSMIPVERQQRVPMIVLVKCGAPNEAGSSKPGNRGKRDSQVILMSFLQKVMFDERMTELEYELFNGIWKITGIPPDFYEIMLMVDADTKVFPDSLTHMVSAMVKDSEIMGLCGETKIANKGQSWVTMIQVFEYFISHHQLKSFESCFGGVTCLPGCFCMYRIKTPKGGQNYWVPILANPDIVEHYSENVVDTLHKKNLYLLGEDRYLSTLMLKTFPKRKQVFVPQAVCKTTVPDKFKVLLSQRRRWINSTIHNLMELVLVRDLCGTFCFSMQFVVFIDLVGCIVLPAAICFTIYVGALGIKAAVTHTAAPVIPLVLLALILGLPGVLIVVTAHRPIYVVWMAIYLLSLPIWNLVLPAYAYWHFDDFSWGDTRQTAGEKRGAGKGGHDGDGEFDSSQITMKRWVDFEQERRLRGTTTATSTAGHTVSSTYRPQSSSGPPGYTHAAAAPAAFASTYTPRGHSRKPSMLAYESYHD